MPAASDSHVCSAGFGLLLVPDVNNTTDDFASEAETATIDFLGCSSSIRRNGTAPFRCVASRSLSVSTPSNPKTAADLVTCTAVMPAEKSTACLPSKSAATIVATSVDTSLHQTPNLCSP